MKKAIAIVLCLLAIFSCACQKEEPEPIPTETGVLYTVNDITQNTLVTLVIEDEVQGKREKDRIAGTIHNDTDFTCRVDPELVLYKYMHEEGKWTPASGGLAVINSGISVAPHSTLEVDTFWLNQDLDVGIYRLQTTAVLKDAPETSGFYVVAYFEITAPTTE